MAIKYDCKQCRNRGFYRAVIWERPPEMLACGWLSPLNREHYKTRDVACSCEAGKQYEIWQNRMSHPEYVNPFLVMTDDEIIETLTRASENQRINDSEFEIQLITTP